MGFMTYSGAEHERIDGPMLSKILYFMSTRLPHGTKLCLLGGSALTFLGVRTSGSEDVDFLPLNNESDISDAIRYINDSLSRKKISIEIHEYGIPQKIYSLTDEAFVQNLGTTLPSAHLPHDFGSRTHKIKKIPWVMPEGGKEVSFPTHKLLKHVEIYTPNLLDMFLVKLFASRKKDQEDLRLLLDEIPKTKRYYKRYAKELHERLFDFLEKNRKRVESKRAITLYINLQKKYSYLEPLDEARAQTYL